MFTAIAIDTATQLQKQESEVTLVAAMKALPYDLTRGLQISIDTFNKTLKQMLNIVGACELMEYQNLQTTPPRTVIAATVLVP